MATSSAQTAAERKAKTPRRRAAAATSTDGASAAAQQEPDRATAYAVDVCAGRIVVGPHVRKACERHLRDLESGHERGLQWSAALAERAISFFGDELRLNGGDFEGVPFELLPWQAFCVGSLFGWLKGDGWRRFSTFYAEVGKGNGKSPLAAGIGLYCLTADGEPRAEVYAAATKKDQAMILFRDAVAMVDQSPRLRSRIVKSGGQNCWNLAYMKTASFFRAISSEDKQSGPRPHCSLIDELHEHPDGNVCDMLEFGTKGRRQALTVKITNSGFDRETVCYRDHEYSIRVLDGIDDDDSWFAYVCALDDGDEPIGPPTDPFRGRACWIKANPSLGHSIREDYIEKQIRRAVGMPALISSVMRLNFCKWVGAENPWIDGELWMRCEQPFDPIAMLRQCEEVVGALDLSGTRDLTALTLAGKMPDGRIAAFTEFWTPLDTLIERSRTDRVPYDTWVEQGFMRATPGRAVDYSWVARRLAELCVELPLSRCCFDPYRIAFLEPEIDEAGAEVDLIAHPQGGYRTQPKHDKYGRPIPSLWMPRSIELLGNAIGESRIVVHKNPCMTHCSASAVLVATDDKGNLIFSKRKSRGRIDGVVTLAMAVGLLESSDDDGGLADMLRGPAIT